jgi:hypothetical protein
MTFKDVAKADIDNVFVDTDVFFDEHLVDGKSMRVLIDNNELIERQQKVGLEAEDGVYRAKLLVYIPADDYGPKPQIGKRLILDGKRLYTITDCVPEDGIYSMTLEAVRGAG